MEVKTTLAQNCKKINSTCSLHVIHRQLLKRNIYYFMDVLGLQKRNIDAIHVCSSLNRNRPVPVQCVQTPAVRCPADVILPSMTLQNAVRWPGYFKYRIFNSPGTARCLKKNDKKIVRFFLPHAGRRYHEK